MHNVNSKQEEENHAAPDQDDVMTDVKREIENRLNALNFESLPKNKKLIQFVGPTGVGKTTTIAKVAASSMINEKKQVALITEIGRAHVRTPVTFRSRMPSSA